MINPPRPTSVKSWAQQATNQKAQPESAVQNERDQALLQVLVDAKKSLNSLMLVRSDGQEQGHIKSNISHQMGCVILALIAG